MRKQFLAAVTCGLLALGAQGQASSIAGYVKKVAYTGSRVFVWIDASRDGASCNTPGAGDRYELNGGTAEGQTQLSIILTAQAIHKSVFLSGTNACPSDTETIGYLEVQP